MKKNSILLFLLCSAMGVAAQHEKEQHLIISFVLCDGGGCTKLAGGEA